MLGYFYWDPAKEMLPFNIPILDRPILWYGFFFALGFFLGYWIFLYLIRRFLFAHPDFTKADVANWPELLSIMQGADNSKRGEIAKSIVNRLDAINKDHCLKWRPGVVIQESLKDEIVLSLNAIIREPRFFQGIQQTLLIKRFLKYLVQEQAASPATSLHHLLLSDLFSPCFASLQARSKAIVERVTVSAIIGTIIGARIGDILFYQPWSNIKANPFAFLKIWEGGLASHGGTVGVCIAIFILAKRMTKQVPSLTWKRLYDLIVIPTALVAALIRVGNFFNQEILGKATDLPWAVVFGHPADYSAVVPRHPVQLYEAITYFSTFVLLISLWRFVPKMREAGKITGLFFILIFGLRFFVEFWKMEQSLLIDAQSVLSMGQYLSLPFILFGAYLFFQRKQKVPAIVSVKGQ